MRPIPLLAGPVLALAAFLLIPDGTPAARTTAALAAWMAAWWLTEAIPVYATALLPLAVLPLSGAMTMAATAAAYAHPLVFLFLGGFMLALALERWELHRRFALAVLRVIGTRPTRLVGGFMLVSATLSLWISNTATALVMLPIAMSVITATATEPEQRQRLACCLLLGVAYAASIGGIGTIIGTPPNLFTVAFMERELGLHISFLRWMAIGMPVVIIMLPVTWLLLTRVLFPLVDSPPTGATVDTRPAPWTRGARLTLTVFLLTALSWMLRPLLVKLPWLADLSDTGIAIIATLLLFILPADARAGRGLLDWEATARIPWGVLLLFGGGLALADAIRGNGIGELLAQQLQVLGAVAPIVMTLAVVTLVIFLTELTSNLATTSALVPVFAAMALGLGIDPLLVIIPATIAASCAFMLPVATPPNAIVFSSGLISTRVMARAGLWLNIAGIIVITVLSMMLRALLD